MLPKVQLPLIWLKEIVMGLVSQVFVYQYHHLAADLVKLFCVLML